MTRRAFCPPLPQPLSFRPPQPRTPSGRPCGKVQTLSLDQWQDLFGAPDKIAEEWRGYLEAPILEEAADRLRVRAWSGSAHNRPTQWFPPPAAVSADSRPG